MGIFKTIKLYEENKELKKEVEYWKQVSEFAENELVKMKRNYRHQLGVKQELNDKIATLDHSLYKANKTIRSIVEVVEENKSISDKTKLKKIVELAKFEDDTSST